MQPLYEGLPGPNVHKTLRGVAGRRGMLELQVGKSVLISIISHGIVALQPSA